MNQEVKNLINKAHFEANYMVSRLEFDYCWHPEELEAIIKHRLAESFASFLLEKPSIVCTELSSAIKYTIEGFFFTKEEIEALIRKIKEAVKQNKQMQKLEAVVEAAKKKRRLEKEEHEILVKYAMSGVDDKNIVN